MTHATLGSISHGTMRPEDLIPTFVDELESLDSDKRHADLIAEARAIDWDAQEGFNDDDCCEVLSDLFDALESFAPDYCYFGAHPGDGADYGFWPIEDFQQQAKDDGCLIVADLSEVPEDFAGGLILHVNDHGNATLYAQDCTGERREVWSIV